MDKSLLSRRLARIHPAGNSETLSGRNKDRFLKGWEKAGQYVWTRTVRIPSPFGTGTRSILADKDLRDLVFYDLETTGLSSGAGTIAFLAGFGRIEKKELVIEQIFLADYPGEPEFLGIISPFLDNRYCYVSYNGKSFDRHLLKTRFQMNRMKPGGVADDFIPCQVDLLMASRKLWKRTLTDCSLFSIEKFILKLHRETDIPGELVPIAWFQYLQSGDPGRIIPVVEHHKQDIASLALLLAHIDGLMENPLSDGRHDRAGLGRLLSRVDSGRSFVAFRKGFQEGDLRCGSDLTDAFKRLGRWDDAVAVWREGSDRDPTHITFHTGFAKYLEHKIRDFQAALGIVERLLAQGVRIFPQSVVADLGRRRERLKKKIANSSGKKSSRTVI